MYTGLLLISLQTSLGYKADVIFLIFHCHKTCKVCYGLSKISYGASDWTLIWGSHGIFLGFFPVQSFPPFVDWYHHNRQVFAKTGMQLLFFLEVGVVLQVH